MKQIFLLLECFNYKSTLWNARSIAKNGTGTLDSFWKSEQNPDMKQIFLVLHFLTDLTTKSTNRDIILHYGIPEVTKNRIHFPSNLGSILEIQAESRYETNAELSV